MLVICDAISCSSLTTLTIFRDVAYRQLGVVTSSIQCAVSYPETGCNLWKPLPDFLVLDGPLSLSFIAWFVCGAAPYQVRPIQCPVFNLFKYWRVRPLDQISLESPLKGHM
jgi:hypothetical protein